MKIKFLSLRRSLLCSHINLFWRLKKLNENNNKEKNNGIHCREMQIDFFKIMYNMFHCAQMFLNKQLIVKSDL